MRRAAGMPPAWCCLRLVDLVAEAVEAFAELAAGLADVCFDVASEALAHAFAFQVGVAFGPADVLLDCAGRFIDLPADFIAVRCSSHRDCLLFQTTPRIRPEELTPWPGRLVFVRPFPPALPADPAGWVHRDPSCAAPSSSFCCSS